jgi:hypothetical protein
MLSGDDVSFFLFSYLHPHVLALLSKVLSRPLNALNSARWAAKAQTRIVTVELAPAVAMLASPERSVQSISMNPVLTE